MSWSTATTWAANLVYHDNVRNVDYSNWRLPTMVDTGIPGCNLANSGTDCGYNVQTVNTSTNPVTVYSELAHMYYNNLGNKGYYNTAGQLQSGYGLVNDPNNPNDESLFSNLQSAVYWSNLSYPWVPGGAWHFYAQVGGQFAHNESGDFYAWAVRPGDVAAVAAVPEADTWALLLAGLGLVGVAARRRRG